MPDVVSNDELNALAAEYVLGTLDYDERKGASALLEVDATFRGIVRIWERRFGELHLMVESVEPDPQLWARIRPKVPGIEQFPPAIPSHADTLTPVVAAAPPAVTVAPAMAGSPAETPADALPDPTTAEAPAPAVSEAASAEPNPDEPKLGDDKLGDDKLGDDTSADLKAAAVKETELRLAELAALLPVAAAVQEALAHPDDAAPTEQVPEDAFHARAAEEIPRGFVPPAPMSTRGAPLVVEKPVPRTGRGWMAGTLAMGLVAVVLAGLISAWRFFPERLPAQLRAYSVLNLVPPPPPPAMPAKKERPRLPAFDE